MVATLFGAYIASPIAVDVLEGISDRSKTQVVGNFSEVNSLPLATLAAATC